MSAVVPAHEGERLFETDTLEVVTFDVANTLYACPVSQVRYIEQDNRKTTRVETSNGLNEVTTYQERPVPIYDFCEILGAQAEYKTNRALMKDLKHRQREHLSWYSSLETSLKTGAEFTLAKDSSECSFGQWYSSYEAGDAILKDILADIEEPHRKLHSLAGKFLSLRNKGKEQEAIQQLEHERNRSLTKLIELLNMAISRIDSITKPILLFVETQKRMVAFRLNAISDLKSINQSHFCSFNEIEFPDFKQLHFMAGFVQIEQGSPMVLIDWNLFNIKPDPELEEQLIKEATG